MKDINSVAMPWVDMTEDVRLIREGYGARLPNKPAAVNPVSVTVRAARLANPPAAVNPERVMVRAASVV